MANSISLGFSPCPNDTFMFDAMVNNRLSSNGLTFTSTIADVEELNRLALNTSLDVTKISMNAYARVADRYEILNAGSALGNNCGPLLVSKKPFAFNEMDNLKIAIPGKLTTANLLLSIFAPNAKNKTEIIFSDIEKEVLNGNFDAGLIIHESRFTYHERGLLKIADMGELWEQHTHCPIPLGCIVIKKSLPDEVKLMVNNLMTASVQYAFKNPGASKKFIREHAQELSDEVTQSHIDLYVNSYSENLGDKGKAAIRLLLSEGMIHNLIPNVQVSFVDEHINSILQQTQ
jgi:1,4-dihydroxy-6-naphthoate synthase